MKQAPERGLADIVLITLVMLSAVMAGIVEGIKIREGMPPSQNNEVQQPQALKTWCRHSESGFEQCGFASLRGCQTLKNNGDICSPKP